MNGRQHWPGLGRLEAARAAVPYLALPCHADGRAVGLAGGAVDHGLCLAHVEAVADGPAVQLALLTPLHCGHNTKPRYREHSSRLGKEKLIKGAVRSEGKKQIRQQCSVSDHSK